MISARHAPSGEVNASERRGSCRATTIVGPSAVGLGAARSGGKALLVSDGEETVTGKTVSWVASASPAPVVCGPVQAAVSTSKATRRPRITVSFPLRHADLGSLDREVADRDSK